MFIQKKNNQTEQIKEQSFLSRFQKNKSDD